MRRSVSLSGAAFSAAIALSAPVVAQDGLTQAAETPPFFERAPEEETPADAAPHLFTPILDAALAEGGSGWVPVDKTWGPGTTIRVCFQNGSPDLNRLVVSHARAWNEIGADVRLDFGPANNPRVCSPGSVEPIRVAFNDTRNNWSDYGRDALIGRTPYTYGSAAAWNQPSLHLDVNDIRGFFGRGLIIHEFGHALGLYHEHQKPIDAGCEPEFNWPRVYDTTWRFNRWSRAKTDSQLRPIDFGRRPVEITPGIDLDSVMLYPMPPSNFVRGRDSYCYTPVQANEISADDADLVRYVYGEESWSAGGAYLASAAAGAVEAGQPNVARALALYSLPLDRLTGIADGYSSELAFGFSPSGRSASDMLDSELDAALAELVPDR
jgi:hypothetical protein